MAGVLPESGWTRQGGRPDDKKQTWIKGGETLTVQATREATHQELRASAALRAQQIMAEGVTTIEVKSGYGLELAAERRLLEVARDLGQELPVSVRKTFLGLHALPREFAADRQRFVNEVSGPWLESLAAAGLVDGDLHRQLTAPSQMYLRTRALLLFSFKSWLYRPIAGESRRASKGPPWILNSSRNPPTTATAAIAMYVSQRLRQ